jgi:azurin
MAQTPGHPLPPAIQTMKSKLLIFLLMLAAFAGCIPGWAADSTVAPRVVTIRGGADNTMKFDVTSITAAPGEIIKVVLVNASTLPKAAMGHNWVLLAAGTDPVAFAAAVATEGENGYIPEKKDKILAYVGLLGPKETGEVTFTAPSEPGEYPFLCSFPAHCLVGMKGVLVVKK